MMKIKLILIFLHGILIYPLYSQNISDDLDILFNRLNENNQFSGVALIAQKTNLLYHKAFGFADREWNISNTINTRFNIQSISKTIVALAVLQYVKNGILHLDGSVVDYIPNYKGGNGDKSTLMKMNNL